MSEVEIDPPAVSDATVTRGDFAARAIGGGAVTFVLFLAVGAVILAFAFKTVHRRDSAELEKNSGARRSHAVITYWSEHGYFASGGLMSFITSGGGPGEPQRAFYKSSSGAYMITGYIVEKIAMAATGEYQWKLLALHNELLVLLTSAIAALLVFRLLGSLDLERRHVLVVSVALQAVFLTFPQNLWMYWELRAQSAALPFALLFLVFEHATQREPSWRGVRIAQAVTVFLLVWIESIFGMFFIAVFLGFKWLVDRDGGSLKSTVLKTVAPAAAALLLFWLQTSWVKLHYPEPMQGSELMFRTGLDGSTQYYGDHLDIIFGRAVPRGNFPVNREFLFDWQWRFIAGVIAAMLVIVASMRRPQLRPLLMTVVTLAGAYVLYGATFSQAVVIHPYQYDLLIFTPLMLALFAFAPSILDLRFRSGGVIALATLLVAFWCAMFQMRQYAMWFPAP